MRGSYVGLTWLKEMRADGYGMSRKVSGYCTSGSKGGNGGKDDQTSRMVICFSWIRNVSLVSLMVEIELTINTG